MQGKVLVQVKKVKVYHVNKFWDDNDNLPKIKFSFNFFHIYLKMKSTLQIITSQYSQNSKGLLRIPLKILFSGLLVLASTGLRIYGYELFYNDPLYDDFGQIYTMPWHRDGGKLMRKIRTFLC